MPWLPVTLKVKSVLPCAHCTHAFLLTRPVLELITWLIPVCTNSIAFSEWMEMNGQVVTRVDIHKF